MGKLWTDLCSQQPHKEFFRELDYFLCIFKSLICKHNVLVSQKLEEFPVLSGCSACGNTSGFVRSWFVESGSVFPLPDHSLKRYVVIQLCFFFFDWKTLATKEKAFYSQHQKSSTSQQKEQVFYGQYIDLCFQLLLEASLACSNNKAHFKNAGNSIISSFGQWQKCGLQLIKQIILANLFRIYYLNFYKLFPGNTQKH